MLVKLTKDAAVLMRCLRRATRLLRLFAWPDTRKLDPCTRFRGLTLGHARLQTICLSICAALTTVTSTQPLLHCCCKTGVCPQCNGPHWVSAKHHSRCTLCVRAHWCCCCKWLIPHCKSLCGIALGANVPVRHSYTRRAVADCPIQHCPSHSTTHTHITRTGFLALPANVHVHMPRSCWCHTLPQPNHLHVHHG